MAAKALIAEEHNVVLHARNEKRGQEAVDKVPRTESVVTADVGSIHETKQLASKVNALGKFDAVIHPFHEVDAAVQSRMQFLPRATHKSVFVFF